MCVCGGDAGARLAELDDARVLLVRESRIAAAAIAALPRLRGIVRYGIGVDSIDLAAAVQAVRMLRGEPPLHWLNRWTTEEGTLQ